VACSKHRVDDWWIQSPLQDSGNRALVERYEATLMFAKAPGEVLGLDEEGVVPLDNAADAIEKYTSQLEAVNSDLL